MSQDSRNHIKSVVSRTPDTSRVLSWWWLRSSQEIVGASRCELRFLTSWHPAEHHWVSELFRWPSARLAAVPVRRRAHARHAGGRRQAPEAGLAEPYLRTRTCALSPDILLHSNQKKNKKPACDSVAGYRQIHIHVSLVTCWGMFGFQITKIQYFFRCVNRWWSWYQYACDRCIDPSSPFCTYDVIVSIVVSFLFVYIVCFLITKYVEM